MTHIQQLSIRMESSHNTIFIKQKILFINKFFKPPFFQWRLRMLWQHLGECGYQDYHLEYIWQQIEDAVIKTILVALPEMRKEFHEMETISAYNTYKILGVVLLVFSFG